MELEAQLQLQSQLDQCARGIIQLASPFELAEGPHNSASLEYDSAPTTYALVAKLVVALF